MKRFSRRDLLRLMMISGGSLTLHQFLTACGLKPPAEIPTFVSRATEASTETISSIATGAPVSADLVVARGDDPEEMVRRVAI